MGKFFLFVLFGAFKIQEDAAKSGPRACPEKQWVHTFLLRTVLNSDFG